jgi:hypothetical protein
MGSQIINEGLEFEGETFGERHESINYPLVVMDEGEKMNLDQVFESMVLEQSVKKFNENS